MNDLLKEMILNCLKNDAFDIESVKTELKSVLSESSNDLFEFDIYGCCNDADFCNKGTDSCFKVNNDAECIHCYFSSLECDLVEIFKVSLPIGMIAEYTVDILKDLADKDSFLLLGSLNHLNLENNQLDLVFKLIAYNKTVFNKYNHIDLNDADSLKAYLVNYISNATYMECLDLLNSYIELKGGLNG